MTINNSIGVEAGMYFYYLILFSVSYEEVCIIVSPTDNVFIKTGIGMLAEFIYPTVMVPLSLGIEPFPNVPLYLEIVSSWTVNLSETLHFWGIKAGIKIYPRRR